ncbi:helix-turn-helix domain-containing protein [Rhodanobacter sp. L36]|uniref:helix-turn-helix domain-containing protein n=1 Tax=Rhodanobacter sp. L36 TaxID=1747221 RepID=UPI00131AF7E8|nr:helix-turn-helix domain-containing protein [Rhodanobacter sp. L36]
MNTSRNGASATRSLEVLGIDDMEERAYRALLSHRTATAEDIAVALSLSPRKTQRLLDSIESKGLASHSPERPRRYIAAAPELAVEALASQRQADIERARSTIAQLKEHSVNARNSHEPEQLVELITNRTALGQILSQLRQTAQHEAILFQRAPVLIPHGDQPSQKKPGVRVRSISDSGLLALPGALNRVRLDIEDGEEARVFPTLPVKMFVVDRRVGLLPLNADDPGSPVMMVRSSSLLDALCALFELTWEHSTPIIFSPSGQLQTGESDKRLSDAARQVIPLLAAGLNDKAIAHEAGMSATTLNRRVAELMKSFDTRTRFQLGWRAALDAFPERVTAPARSKKSPRIG